MIVKIFWFVLGVILIIMGIAQIIQGDIGWGIFTALLAGICLAGVIDSEKN